MERWYRSRPRPQTARRSSAGGVLLISALAFVVFSQVNQQMRSEAQYQLKQRLDSQLTLRQKILRSTFLSTYQQIRLLHAMPAITGIVEASGHHGKKRFNGLGLKQWQQQLGMISEALMAEKNQFNQILLLQAGQEATPLFHSSRAPGHNASSETLTESLPRLRDEIEIARNRSSNHLYVSEVMLGNARSGEISSSYYRVLLPVFNVAGDFFGALVVVVDADQILEEVSQNLDPTLGLYVINGEGQILSQRGILRQRSGNAVVSGGGRDSFYLPIIEKTSGSILPSFVRASDQAAFYFRESSFYLLPGHARSQLRLLLAKDARAFETGIEGYRNTQLLTVVIFLVGALWFFFLIQRYREKKRLLKDTRARFKGIVEGSLDAIVSMTESGQIISWNRAAELIFGFAAVEALGHDIFALLTPLGHPQFNRSTLANIIYHNHLVPQFPVVIRTRDGDEKDIAITLSPIKSHKGKIIGVAAIMRDVSEQRRIEREIEALNRGLEKQVQSRTRALQAASQEAQQASQSKTRFITHLSHEIRTPLNTLFGVLRMIRRHPLTEHQGRYLKLAERSADHLLALMNEILDLSKIEAGKLEMNACDMDLQALLSEIAIATSIRAQEKGVTFVLDLSALDIAGVNSDPQRIRQILTNLISNAIKFTDQGNIILRAESRFLNHERVWFKCSVTDTGVGMEQKTIDSLFEPFFQADKNSAQGEEGSGLGLAIAQQLTQMLGGFLDVKSIKGKGSVFSLELELRPALYHLAATTCSDLSGYQAVLLDSNTAASEVMTETLRRLGVAITCCHEEAAFWRHLEGRKKSLDFILLGNEFLDNRAIRERFRHYAVCDRQVIFGLIPEIKSSLVSTDSGTQPFTHIAMPIAPVALSQLIKAELEQKQCVSFQGRTENENPPNDDARSLYPRLLVIDDDAINCEIIEVILDDLPVNVSCVCDAYQALEELKQAPVTESFSLVLMDCQMPGLNGFQLTEKIRDGLAGEHNRHIPVMAMTANAMVGEREYCLKKGMNDYVSKPLDSSEVIRKVRNWLGLASAKKVQASEHSEGTPYFAGSVHNEPAVRWSAEKALARVKQRKERLNQYILLFLESVTAHSEELRAAITAREYDMIIQAAHAIKGSALNFDAHQLVNACQQLDQMAQGQMNEQLLAFWPEFEVILAELLSEIRLYQKTLQVPAG